MINQKKIVYVELISFAFILIFCTFVWSEENSLPVIDPKSMDYELYISGVTNNFSIEQIQAAILDGDRDGLIIDFNAYKTLLNSAQIDPAKIYGLAISGLNPFEADEDDYTYKQFRANSRIKNGIGKLNINDICTGEYPESKDKGRIAVRFVLYLEQQGSDWFLGLYDTFVNFQKVDTIYVKAPTIYEGPFVNLIRSDDPSKMVVSFKTDRDCQARVVVENSGQYEDSTATGQHEIEVTGLEPNHEYKYHIEVFDLLSKTYNFKTAPQPGEGTVTFGFTGNSREGRGEGERNLMGVNHYIFERELNIASQKGADFFIFGGDMINGHTSIKADFQTQLYSWKQAAAGFLHRRPIYPAIGDRESLFNRFRTKQANRVKLDKWPYETDSAEAVFAAEFVNPENGPEPSDPRRPTYKENVYSFQYGPVKCIALNSNYWTSDRPVKFGGAPEAYIFNDQMNWLRHELWLAENDSTVKYIILYTHESIFPNGGHVRDAMWYDGNNNIRAFTNHQNQVLVLERAGIIDVRNIFINIVANSAKVAAVLTSGEPNYSKILISDKVTVGDPKKISDDSDRDGLICEEDETCSPLENLMHPVWYLTCGGAGAPYYGQEATPWNTFWQENSLECPEPGGCFDFSSQHNFFLFKADSDKISVEIINPYGRQIDKIDNLMAVKQPDKSD